MNQPKRSFEPGEFVKLFNGQVGIVLGPQKYQMALKKLKQGNKPGRYFVPGCCQHPDYIIQIPVLFEDGTYDIIRAMNIRRIEELPAEKETKIQSYITRLQQQ